MSKAIKQMEMDALEKTFRDVRDLVFLSVSGVSATADNQMRLALRKKNVRLHVVKNSLARRVFDKLGIQASSDTYWLGHTLIAWGHNSLKELSLEIDALMKKNDKIKAKGALADGQEVTFEQAKKMLSKTEAIGRVVGLAMSPAARLVAQIQGPAGRIAGQVKTLRERPAPAEPAAPAPG
jgi:large subunit ribosomal protein L10